MIRNITIHFFNMSVTDFLWRYKDNNYFLYTFIFSDFFFNKGVFFLITSIFFRFFFKITSFFYKKNNLFFFYYNRLYPLYFEVVVVVQHAGVFCRFDTQTPQSPLCCKQNNWYVFLHCLILLLSFLLCFIDISKNPLPDTFLLRLANCISNRNARSNFYQM